MSFHHPPPTPPSNGDLQWGMRQLAEYNSISPYNQDPYRLPDGVAAQGYDTAQSDYYAVNDDNLYLPSMPARVNSPVTPQSPVSEIVRRTRSSRSAARSSSPLNPKRDTSGSRVGKSLRTKKGKGGKVVISKTAKLEQPLSVLTKDMGIPLKDIEALVNRSAEVRQREAAQHNGYIRRPMNSFMLYRAAYAERTKAWCSQNNHQVVSSVSGESWPLEPQHIKDQYIEYAKIDRDNHANAHPTYKFSPSKSKGGARRKQGGYDTDEDEDDFDDLDDPDREYRPPGQRGSGRQQRRRTRDAGVSFYGEQNHHYDNPFNGSNGGSAQAFWEPTSYGKPLPASTISGNMYHQQQQLPYYNQPNAVPDMRFHRSLSPAAQYPSALPDIHHPDMFLPHSNSPAAYDSQIDPSLLGLNNQGVQAEEAGLSGGNFGNVEHLFDDSFEHMDHSTSHFDESMWNHQSFA